MYLHVDVQSAPTLLHCTASCSISIHVVYTRLRDDGSILFHKRLAPRHLSLICLTRMALSRAHAYTKAADIAKFSLLNKRMQQTVGF